MKVVNFEINGVKVAARELVGNFHTVNTFRGEVRAIGGDYVVTFAEPAPIPDPPPDPPVDPPEVILTSIVLPPSLVELLAGTPPESRTGISVLTGEGDVSQEPVTFPTTPIPLSLSGNDNEYQRRLALLSAMKDVDGPIEAPAPTITSLQPATVQLGEPNFDIHVIGTGFTAGSKIMWNGLEEPTTFVSEGELTTGVNMDVAVSPIACPVYVLNEDGKASNSMDFTFTEANAGGGLSTKQKVVGSFVKDDAPKGIGGAILNKDPLEEARRLDAGR